MYTEALHEIISCQNKYLTLIDASSGYHNLKLNEKLSYLTTFFVCLAGCRYMQLPFGTAPVDEIIQKIDELFSGMSYVSSITDDKLETTIQQKTRYLGYAGRQT